MSPAKDTAKGKGSAMPPIPKPDEQSKEWFRTVVPEDPRVSVKPMFGNLSAFVNGNMFMGLFGPDLFVRLPDHDRSTVEKDGGRPFEPMPGRPMTGYVILPDAWRKDAKKLGKWVGRSLDWASALPAKQPKPPKQRG
jgi:TfoX/Sxy family transcriptional regulator of competence genes